MNSLCKFIVTGFGTGYLPAPGTCSSIIVGIPLVMLFHSFLNTRTLIVATFMAIALVHYTLPELQGHSAQHDPQVIVLDEIIGMLWAFQGISLSPLSLATGTLLFRFFDITKLGPIGWAELLPDGIGIVADDVVAGIATHLILRFVLQL